MKTALKKRSGVQYIRHTLSASPSNKSRPLGAVPLEKAGGTSGNAAGRKRKYRFGRSGLFATLACALTAFAVFVLFNVWQLQQIGIGGLALFGDVATPAETVMNQIADYLPGVATGAGLLGVLLLLFAGWQAWDGARFTAARQKKREEESRLDRALEGLPDACLVLNHDRQVTAHNSSVTSLLQGAKAGIDHRTSSSANDPQMLKGARAESLYSELCHDSTLSREALEDWLNNLHADSTSAIELLDRQDRHLLIRERPTADGEITAVIRDISEHKKAAEELRLATDYDQLTGLPNRALFMRKLRTYTQHVNQSVALIVCDIRNFRQINDAYGQDAGDHLLKDIAKLLQEALPKEAVVARVAGDEFGIMIHPVMDRGDIEDTLRGILDQLRTGIATKAGYLSVAASVGVAYGPEHGLSPVELKNAADSACAQAKQSAQRLGVHAFAVFDPAVKEKTDRANKIDRALQRAISRGEFQIEYQPQVDIASNLTVGMEALLRWYNDELGQVSPAEFIPLAEKSGFILELGDWVLQKSIEDYQQLALFGTSPGALSVNISRRQFDDPALVDKICDVLADTHMRPDRLTLEVTETAILDNRSHAGAILRQLHELGVNLSIDDFGVGYSSFLELRDFPVTEVKIDRSFVTNVATCDNSQKIIQAIVSVAEAIGATIVAEGIETREQLDMVHSLGCHRAQGFFLCEPMSATTFPDLVLGSGSISA